MAEYRVVDVFAESKYRGNPLAVVLGAASLDAATMQSIAREFNLCETTFVTGEGGGGWDVRIFTPNFEIPFAGHPTLGTAAVLREEHDLGEALVLNLGIGRVPVSFRLGEGGELAWMDAPVPVLGKEHPRGEGAALLGLDESDLDPQLPVQEVSTGLGFIFVPLAGLDALKRARLDLDVCRRTREPETCVYLFCREGHEPGREIAARMLFDDGYAAREDPATGSASACLGGYLLHHRVFGDGSVAVRAEQGYEIERPSLIHIQAQTQDGEARVRVGGRVIPVARGELV